MTNILASTCMLSVLKISQWTARKLDKGATARVLSDHKATAGAGNFNKSLVSKQALGDIASLAGEARTYHYSETLAWLDDGPRILPAKRYNEYSRHMERLEQRFAEHVDAFVSAYPSYVDDAAGMLGDLFRRADYPSETRIRDHFRFQVAYMPMPDKSDFRAELPDTVVAQIQDDIQRRTHDAMGLAVRDVFERVHERVAAMVEKLSNYKPARGDEKASGIFRDSLIGNVRDLVAIMPDLNVTNDARIADLAADMAALCKHDAETLRESDTLRHAVAAKAASILQDVSDMIA